MIEVVTSIFTKETGIVKNTKTTLILKPDAKSKVFAPRQIRYALEQWWIRRSGDKKK